MEDITNSNTNNNIEANIPPQYKPMSMWSYIGYSLLFLIPVVGLICMFIFAFNNDNINRRNFARYHILMLVISVILAILLASLVMSIVAYIFSIFLS